MRCRPSYHRAPERPKTARHSAPAAGTWRSRRPNLAGEGGDAEVLQSARERQQELESWRQEQQAAEDRVRGREERQARVVSLLQEHGLFSFYA